MRFITFIIAMFLGLVVSYGQTREAFGTVIDKDGNTPVAGAIVQVRDSAGNTYQYAITDEKGEFRLKYDISVANYLRFQCMSYKSQEIPVISAQSPMTVVMTPQPTRLRDVIVKAPDIEQRSDTLTYYMSKYATAEDKKMTDVLKRLPGIKVEDNGQIKYNGEPINKFYIDGSDFMDDRYGIATENINPADVTSVEVLENHQPMQVLKGLEFSQQAGLNIKLKEEARHRWIAILNGGIGLSPMLYDASAFAMRIAGKWQNMESVRVNNTGWNPASQSQLQISNDIFGNGYIDEPWSDYINVGISGTPIDESRTRDNFSILANTSNSWHIGDGKDMKFNLTYEDDILDYLTGYETNYFDEDIPSFIERNSMRTQAHRLNGQWALQINRSDIFLKDNLYVNADWNNAASDVSGTLTLLQRAETPSITATNDLQLVKRIDDNLLTVSSRNRYAYKPHSLLVSGTEEAAQDITSGDFRSVTEARYGWISGRWRLYARGGADFNHHGFHSSLQGVGLPFGMENDLSFSLLKTYLSPEVSYQSYKWRASIAFPVSHHLQHLRNNITVGNNTYSHFGITPTLYVRHQISAKMEISAQLKYSLIPLQAEMLIPGLIMTDFRNLRLSEPVTDYSDSRSVMMNLKYRNPITSVFFNLTGLYEWDNTPYMQNQVFSDNYIIETFVPSGNDGTSLAVNGGVSKGLLSGRLTVGVDASYARTSTETMRQGEVSPYTLASLSVKPGLKGYFTDWLSTDYSFVYSRNTMEIDSVGESDRDVIKQYLTFTFVPTKKWQMAIGGEHYFTNFSSGTSTNLILLDASIRWNVSKKVDLSLSASNLLNQREYRYASYGLLNETEYTYRLRGRSILLSVQIRL